MYFVYRKKYIVCTGMSFRVFIHSSSCNLSLSSLDILFVACQDFMAGKLPCIPSELPTLNDWENHLTTIFLEVYVICILVHLVKCMLS